MVAPLAGRKVNSAAALAGPDDRGRQDVIAEQELVIAGQGALIVWGQPPGRADDGRAGMR